ncbi:MAG TPA: hypothetical protein VF691_19205 [Cytophagaceae bacterium]
MNKTAYQCRGYLSIVAGEGGSQYVLAARLLSSSGFYKLPTKVNKEKNGLVELIFLLTTPVRQSTIAKVPNNAASAGLL